MRRLTPPSPSLLALADRQEGLVSSVQCDEHGLGSGRRLRLVNQARWSRPARGVYDTVPVPVDQRSRADLHDHRRRRLAVLPHLAYGPGAVSVGCCALALYGVHGLPERITPEITLPGASERRSRDGLVVRRYGLRRPVAQVDGFRVADIHEAFAQAVPTLGRRRAVAVLDSGLHRGLITPDGVALAHDLARGHPGVERTHAWWSLADGRSESPLESFARVELVDAGYPPDDLQRVFLGPDGSFLGRGDLTWLLPDGRWLLLEIDGRSVHDAPEAVYADRARQNRLTTNGVIVVRATSRDLARTGTVSGEVGRVLSRSGWVPNRPLPTDGDPLSPLTA